ncbi:MAG: hypothetical protein M1838_001455 [Thelocarpon superellum]|nr:MAG: hypothetical protein M1838_001455 [Thelocarpon superellum]
MEVSNLLTQDPSLRARRPVTPQSYHASPQTSPKPKHVAFELYFPESPNYRARLPMRVQIFPHDTTDSIITTVKNFYGLYEGPGGAKGVSFEDEQGNTLIARYENFRNNMVVYVRVLLEEAGTPKAYGPPEHPSASPNHFQSEPHAMRPPQPAQALTYGQTPSRPASRTMRKRSVSPPLGRGRRSVSANTRPDPSKPSRSRTGLKSRGSSTHASGPDVNGDAMNGFSDSDGGQGSVSGSRKSRSEQLASAEISLDNIVEGGRRKRAKFESSVPMTTSSSSVSPARRAAPLHGLGPFGQASQRPVSYSQPLPSPQSIGHADRLSGHRAAAGSSYSTPAGNQHGHHLRNRMSASYPPSRRGMGSNPFGHHSGILPTPDPTVASCISDEDVAIQLMRLGDASNISHDTRHSASTLDDGFSGAADAASSTGATSDSDMEDEDEDESDATEPSGLPVGPPREPAASSPIPFPGAVKRKHKHLDDILPSFDSTEPSGDEGARVVGNGYGDEHDRKRMRFDVSGPQLRDAFLEEREPLIKMDPSVAEAAFDGRTPVRSLHGAVKSSKVAKARPLGANKIKVKPSAGTVAGANAKVPISPASLTAPSRKTSNASTINFQHPLGEDEEDLSSKPRCQRCRKSKKGCDRQRPCQRCTDAGIGIDGCVSEDEGNGRKGRFGRHMGVVVKKGPGHQHSHSQDHGHADAMASGPAPASAPSVIRGSAHGTMDGLANGIADGPVHAAVNGSPTPLAGPAMTPLSLDKNKKRKR